jgi:hypothetical protein
MLHRMTNGLGEWIDAFEPFPTGRIDPRATNRHSMFFHTQPVENTTRLPLPEIL